MSSTRLSKKDYFLAMLDLVARRSTCARRAVGAIITDKEGYVLSTGYNGVPRGFDHCTDSPCAGINDSSGNTSNCLAVHAEQNAILQCTDINRAYIIYCSCTPCSVCAKLIANTNIKMVICASAYSDKRGVEILLKAKCSVEIEGKKAILIDLVIPEKVK